jgi:DMSO/TMAO reductase YedYZ molybdopterin-dependent catalytic subunit
MLKAKRKSLNKFAAISLAFIMIFSQIILGFPVGEGLAATEQPALTITGTGLEQDVVFYESDWDIGTMEERFYSSNNNFDFHKIWKVKGYDLFSLIGSSNLKADQDYPITFIAVDGARITRTVNQLQSLYYYPDFTVASGELVAPMLAFYRAELFDSPGLPTTVAWQDRELTESDIDNNAPRLHMGQAEGNVSDINQQFFLRDLVRIVVGEERPQDPPPGEIDFNESTYKHINYDGAPYNIDSITGATMTIDGPGMQSYRALSLRQIEEENAGLVRDTYTEVIGGQELENSYEGIKVSYLLDNFVTLRASAGNVLFKDKGRQTIATFSLQEIRDSARKMIVAYGVNEVPLVYTNLDAGYIPEKYNDNGCFKLVYHNQGSEPLLTFSNVAYIYVEETAVPGYEHTEPPYNDPKLTQYIFSLSGSGLGKEVNYTVADLEAMTDMHLEREYSLSNSYYYWYYNTYKGVPLWNLLLESGLDPDIDESTPVNFIAADYYNIPPLTIGEIKNHDLWGYYEKDAWDLGDGKFDGSSVEPLETGYPVLVAYGYNGYPYVTHPSDPGFNSGLGNDGGPLRIIFGKRNYGHTNGSHQVKFAKRVVIGEDIAFSTHSFAPYDSLADSPLTVTVIDEDGVTVIKEENLTVSDIENMIYDVPVAMADRARVKEYFFTHFAGGAGNKISDLYEGVGLSYLLYEKIGLPGTTGTVTFTSENGSVLVVNLEDIPRSDYYNEVTGATWLKPVLAFGKNGYPMVKTRDCDGYVGNPIVNRNGPLMALFGQTEEGVPGSNLANVQSITVNISKDTWAHLEAPYDQYASQTLSIKGSGVRKEHTATVAELEFMQNYIFTGEYCLAKSVDEKYVDSYRGIDIYEYIRREVGFTAGADSVTFKAADGFSKTFPLEDIAKRDYINEVSGAGNLKVMLAYGKNELPLVPGPDSAGYDDTVKNSGGPLRLVIGQTGVGDLNNSKSVSQVVEIVVEAAEGDSWKHDFGVYTQYLDWPVLRITGSQVKEPRTFSLAQVEALNEYILRDLYMGDSEWEGVTLWNIIKDVVGLADGVTTPSSIRVYSGPSYNQLQNTNQIVNGVLNSQGETKEIILGYAVNGYPLVPHASSDGYVNNNEYGPLRLIVEENISMWTKWVDCIVVGTGDYEEPRAEDIIDDPVGPVVFTVTGDGVTGGSKGYTLVELKDLGETTGSYSYRSSGQTVTDECTGVLLANVLVDAGVSNPEWEVKLVTTDGYYHESYTVTLQQAMDDAYLVTYLVGGEPLNEDGTRIHIYRNHDDASTWMNRARDIVAVEVTSTDAPVVFTVAGDGVTGGSRGYTLNELKDLGETTGSYSYRSSGQTVTDECTGVLLADVLADAGVSNPEWEVKLVTTDGYYHESYTVTLQQAMDNAYLVTYLVGGEPLNEDGTRIHIYRNHDDASTWMNRARDIVAVEVTSTDAPVVFTVAGDGVTGGSKGYTLDELKDLGETTGSYSYRSSGQTVTDECTGVLLADVLADAGVSNPTWEVKLATTDGYYHESYTVTLQQAMDDAYLVTYLVGGEPLDAEGITLYVYRHHDNGSSWLNRTRDIGGVEVTSTDLTLSWQIFRNDDGSGLPWASIRCITPDQKGGFWVGTNGGGAAHRSADGTWTVYNTTNSILPHNTIYSIAVDAMDGVWFVGGAPDEGMGLGAVYKRGNNWTIYTSAESDLPADFAQAVVVDQKGGVWFGTAAGAAYRDAQGTWKTYDQKDGLPASSITQIVLDDQGGAWIGFYPVFNDAEGTWLGGYAYLNSQGEVTAHTDDAGFFGQWVRSISLDKDGGVWVCRFGLIDYINPDGVKVTYEDRDLLPFMADGDTIRTVTADGEGGLWVGLTTGGLYYRNPSGQYSLFNSNNTWPTAQFNSVWYLGACTSGALWVGANGGMAYLPPAGPASSNADLQSIVLSRGYLVPNFAPGITEYKIAIKNESQGVPLVGATVADTGRATRVIENAASLGGTSTVTVTAQDGTVKTYSLRFVREIILPEAGTPQEPAEVLFDDFQQIKDLYLNIPKEDVEKYNVSINVPQSVVSPTLTINVAAEEGYRVGYLPALKIQSAVEIEGEVAVVELSFPAGTKVTGPAHWEGTLQLPTMKAQPGAAIDGTVSAVIELGFGEGELFFDKSVRLLIPNQAEKSVGYVKNGVFTEIIRVLAEDTQAYADSQLAPGGDGKIAAGPDLVIWTKHFTEFVTYTAQQDPGTPGDDVDSPGTPGDDDDDTGTPGDDDDRGTLPDTSGMRHKVLYIISIILAGIGALWYKKRYPRMHEEL